MGGAGVVGVACGWNGSASGGALGLLGACRSSVVLWVLDMCVLSVICLEVNHAESLYWVLVAGFLGTLAWSMGGFAGAES